MSAYQSNNDPFADASNVQDRPFTVWGQLDVQAEYVVLQKGVGKVPFDPQAHSVDKRVTAMDIVLTPIAESKIANVVQRDIVAQSDEWKKIVWPSARDLGYTYAGNLNGAWVKAAMVKSGRTWQNAKGETVEATTFHFDKVFQSEQECVADYYADRGAPPADDNPFNQAAGNGNGAGDSHAQGNGQDNHNLNERNTALMFLAALAAQHKGNPDGLAAAIASTPLLNKYFTANSPEVQALLAQGA